MGITAQFYALSSTLADELLTNSDLADEVFWKESSNTGGKVSVLDIDKDWAALRFAVLACQELFDGVPPFDLFAIGKETDVKCTYGLLRYCEPSVVTDASSVLSGISVERVAREASADQLNENDIYPGNGAWDEESAAMIVDHFRETVSFFSDASARGDAMVFGLW
jgi:hypothetical protein